MNRLLALYREDSRTQQIVRALRSEVPSRLQLAGTMGAQEAFVITGSYLADPRPYLIIADNRDEAAYLQNTLSSLFGGKTIRFFPDSFKRPMFFEELNKTNILERTETINRISTSGPAGEVVVTYPESLFEKVVSPEALEKSRIHVKVGEVVDADSVIEILTEYGFAFEDFVYEPGQFSVRGGIIDIFSYGNE